MTDHSVQWGETQRLLIKNSRIDHPMTLKKGFLPIIIIVLLLGTLSVAAQDTPANATDWWRDAVFYEVFVRSFYDSDGDGIGDFNGITERLDYLNDGNPDTASDLGVTALWLMPMMESPSYHGYDVTNYRAVEPDYGTLEDFRRLLDEAHARGIRVIIDFPFNHSSSQHPWFTASTNDDPTYRGWYLWEDENPGFRGPGNQVVWHPRNGSFYYALFWDGMPDLNLTNPAVTTEIFSTARYWLEDVGVDGFRLDGVKHLIEDGNVQENTPATLEWMQVFNDYVTLIQPDAFTVAEVWSNSYFVKPYIERDTVDVAFEFDLAQAILQSVGGERAAALNSIQERTMGIYADARFATFLTNHDQNRVIDELRGDVEKAKLAATLLLTAPGVPFIYYGEEIGMSGRKPDERIRTPMQWDATENTVGFTTARPWEPPQSNATEVNVALQTGDPDSLLSTYRDLIALRAAHPALRRGSWAAVDSPTRQVYSFVRATDAETLLVIVNLADEAISEYALTFEGDLTGRNQAQNLSGEETIAPLNLTPEGGFMDYQPLTSLAPHSLTIIALSP